MDNNQNVLSEKVFKYLLKECPEFLHSYHVLSGFYVNLTTKFTRKVWKDGRIVLTPIKESEDDKTNSSSDGAESPTSLLTEK